MEFAISGCLALPPPDDPDRWRDDAGRWRLRPLSRTTARQVHWLAPPKQRLIPRRYITLIASVGGLGKTHYVIAVGAQGSVAPDPWDTIYISFEDGAEDVLRPRFEAAGADLRRIHILEASEEDLTEFSLPRDIEELRVLIRDVRARLIVVDPVVASIDLKLDAHKDQHVRQVLSQLQRVAREEDAAVATVGHLNRVDSKDAFLRIANSMAFWNAARSVLLITQDGDENDLRLVAQRKANLARLVEIERHVMEEVVLPDTYDPETGERIVTSRMRFVEIADDVNPGDVLGPQTTTKRENAETLLEALLAAGEWHESGQVKQVLTAAGFTERTVKRAAETLRVEYERRGFPSVTWWRLPVGPEPVGPTLVSKSGPTTITAQPREQDGPEPLVGPTQNNKESGPTARHIAVIGDDDFLPFLYAKLEAGVITEGEWHEADRAHRFLLASAKEGS